LVNNNLAPDIRVRDWRIQLDLFKYLAITAFFASTLSRIDQIDSFRGFIFHVLMSLAAFSAIYYFWQLAALVIRKKGNRALNIWQIMGIGFLGGIIFTLCEYACAWLFQVQLNSSFVIELISFSIPAAFWLPAGSVISSNYRRYLSIRKNVREELLQQESVKLARSRALDEYRKRLEGQIQESLIVTTRQASNLFASLKEREVENLPDYLRTISGEYFRLSAHRMISPLAEKDSWVKNLQQALGRLKETVTESVVTRPLNPLWYAIIVSVTAIPPVLQKHSLTRGVEIILIILIASFLVQNTQLRIAQYFKVDLMKLSIASTILNILLPLELVRSLPTVNSERLNPVGYIILVLSVNFLGHLAQAGLLRGEDFRSRSYAQVERVKEDEKEASLIFAGITRSWAQYIHGSFTSKLESSALALETALRENDFAEVEKAISEVGNFLKAETITQPMPQTVLLDEINERCRNWSSLIEFDIKTNISREDSVGVSIQQVGSCIEEAILNSSRHGNCTWIGIEIVNTEALFTIIFKDNGSGFTDHKRGFGSEIFTEATNGQWDIWRDVPRALTILQLSFRKIA
jgi:signal transduction histidine kinase